MSSRGGVLFRFLVGVVLMTTLWVGVASAGTGGQEDAEGFTNYWGSPATWESPPQVLDACYWNHAHARKPSWSTGFTFDYNSFATKRNRSNQTGCSYTNAPKGFVNGELYAQVFLLKTAAPSTICHSLPAVAVPSGTYFWGYGTAMRPQNTACPYNRYWQVWSRQLVWPTFQAQSSMANFTT